MVRLGCGHPGWWRSIKEQATDEAVQWVIGIKIMRERLTLYSAIQCVIGARCDQNLLANA